MNAVPAKVAGVPRVVMVAPTPRGDTNPLVLAAAKLAGVDEVYRIGGAQAIAALAYGTATIAGVAKIVGPGNAYVAAAKRRVFGEVGIDMIAGPSEVLILADGTANPDWVAADLLAQAEHDAAAQSILVTDSPALADAVEEALADQLADPAAPRHRRRELARFRRRHRGLEPRRRDPARRPSRAGASRDRSRRRRRASPPRCATPARSSSAAHTPEAIGDYVGGPNHVLPTARSARFSSGLGVLDFMKRTSILKCEPQSLRALGPAAIALARAEGLEGHARSVALRLDL